MSATKKTTSAPEDGAQSTEDKRWSAASFTDDELVVIHAVLSKTTPKSGKPPKDIKDRVMTLARRSGVTVSDAKAIIRKAMTPSGAKATQAPRPAERKPMPGGKPHGRPAPAAPKQTPAKKKASVASAGTTKPQIILNAIRAPSGASLTTLMNLTGWQAHSVRGCLATLKTQHGYGIDSEKRGSERVYTLVSEPPAKKAAAAAKSRRAPRVTAKKKGR